MSAAYYPMPARDARRMWLTEIIGAAGMVAWFYLIGKINEQ